LPDPRRRGKALYPMDEILLLCLRVRLAVAKTFVDIALFGCMKLEFLRRPPALLKFRAGCATCLPVFDSGITTVVL
jgi:hypothetical protein